MNKDDIRKLKEKLDAFLVEFLKYGCSIAVAYTLLDIIIRALGA